MNAPNKYAVASQGDCLIILRSPIGPITQTDALVLAAWLVALSDKNKIENEFLPMLKTITDKKF